MRPTILFAALGFLVALAPAAAEARPKQTQTEAEFVSYDSEAHTVTVMVRKSGKGAKPPRHLRLKRGKPASFNVKESGSVLTATIVKGADGRRASFDDLESGVKLYVYWVPDEKDEDARFARSLTVFVATEDWNNAEDVPIAASAE
jgi:hypothetical protein